MRVVESVIERKAALYSHRPPENRRIFRTELHVLPFFFSVDFLIQNLSPNVV